MVLQTKRVKVAKSIVEHLRAAGSRGAIIDVGLAKTFKCTGSAVCYATRKLVKAGVIIGTCAPNSHHQKFSLADQYKEGDDWMIAANCRGKTLPTAVKVPSILVSPTLSSKMVEIATTTEELRVAVTELVEENRQLRVENAGLAEENRKLKDELANLHSRLKSILKLAEVK